MVNGMASALVERVPDKIKSFARERYPSGFFENHIKVAVERARGLSQIYPAANKEVVITATLLHDIEHRVTGYEGDNPEAESAKVARKKLKEVGMKSEKVDKIEECIRDHESPDSLEARIVTSASKASHFDREGYDSLVDSMGKGWVDKKLKEELKRMRKFDLPILPEEREYIRLKKEKRGI